MASRRYSTAHFPEADRNRLATAVARAREREGWSQQELADRAKVSKRSIVYLEQSTPRVGHKVLEAVGRALPGWNMDTPRDVLDGGEPPSLETDRSVASERRPGPEDLPQRFHGLHAELVYFGERLSDNPDDFPRLIRLLHVYHELQLHEKRTQSSADIAAQG